MTQPTMSNAVREAALAFSTRVERGPVTLMVPLGRGAQIGEAVVWLRRRATLGLPMHGRD